MVVGRMNAPRRSCRELPISAFSWFCLLFSPGYAINVDREIRFQGEQHPRSDTMSTVRHLNPQTLSKPPGYSHVVEVTGPGRTVYIAGQIGLDRNGKVVGAPG